MESRRIPTTVVNGFIEAGKTTFIMDCLKNDYFYKRGSTLIIQFEEGETGLDASLLSERNTSLVTYSGTGSTTAFIEDSISLYQPDRIYIEANVYNTFELPQILRVDFTATIIDGSTLPLYYANMRQQLQNMITSSNQVVFNRCTKDSLLSFANAFRVMNNKASYLWEGPSGYHEKAFGIMLPFDINKEHIYLDDSDFTPFILDAMSAPEHYLNRTVTLICTAQNENGHILAGRQVMTCCAQDIQFLGLPCSVIKPGIWVRLTAACEVREDMYKRKYLFLNYISGEPAQVPEQQIIGL